MKVGRLIEAVDDDDVECMFSLRVMTSHLYIRPSIVYDHDST